MIVPQLGGFIAQDVPARYVAEENIFLPPHRTVAFNPQLTINDGLLVQSYMKVYGTNYPETIKLVDKAVSDLKSEIRENGKAEINGIGTLAINIDGSYNFEPNEAGIISPALYGLDAVAVKKNDEEKHSDSSKVNSTHGRSKNTRNYTISINKEFVNYVAAAVISIFFYFIWATPVTDSASLSPQQASMLFPQTIQHVKKEIPACIPVDTISAVVAEENLAQESVYIPNEQGAYTIVLASCIPQKNAEAFVKELSDEGYKNVSIFKKRNLIRVVQGQYASEEEAFEELHHLRKQSSRFQDAWILNTK